MSNRKIMKRDDFELGLNGAPFDHRCSFCGSKYWSAAWWGTTLVLCCPKCARDVLPALFADAIFGDKFNQGSITGARELKDFAGIFWRAIANNLAHMNRAPALPSEALAGNDDLIDSADCADTGSVPTDDK
jgi:hypothetical protein